MKYPENQFPEDISQNSGDDNHRHRNCHIATQFLGYSHTDCGRNRLGQQCNIFLMGQPHQPGKQKDPAKACQNPGSNSGGHRFQIIL